MSSLQCKSNQEINSIQRQKLQVLILAIKSDYGIFPSPSHYMCIHVDQEGVCLSLLPMLSSYFVPNPHFSPHHFGNGPGLSLSRSTFFIL